MHKILILIFLFVLNHSILSAQIINKIEISGNKRVSKETVEIYGNLKINKQDLIPDHKFSTLLDFSKNIIIK